MIIACVIDCVEITHGVLVRYLNVASVLIVLLDRLHLLLLEMWG